MIPLDFFQHTLGFSLLCRSMLLAVCFFQFIREHPKFVFLHIFLSVPMGPIHPVWAPAAIHPLVECLLCNHAICQALASIVPCNHGPALDRAPCAQHGAGRAESFYPPIPFSSQPQFREPMNQWLWEKFIKGTDTLQRLDFQD